MNYPTVPTTLAPRPVVNHRQRAMAQEVGQRIALTLQQLGLQPELIEKLVIVESGGMRILFVVLNTYALQGKLQPYQQALHQISTNLNGLPVAVSNSTGFRYAVLLSPPPDLPRRIELPALESGYLQIGQGLNGNSLSVKWDGLGHLLVAGMTRSGKSTFLRSLAYQGIADDALLLIGDRPLTTFPMLAGHANLMKPLADTPEGYFELIRKALVICEDRKRQFAQAQGYPEKLSEYNAWAVKQGQAPLPRVLVILDEYNATANALGRKFEKAVGSLVFQGLKFGVHLVAAAQEFSKNTLGDVRDQFGAVIAFKVKNSSVARNVGVQGAERIPFDRQGLAMTDRWGLVQTYLLPKERLIAVSTGPQPDLVPLNAQEQQLIALAWDTEAGKVSIPKLLEWASDLGWGADWSRWQIRQRVEAWELKGWVRKDPQRANARFVTDEFAQKLGLNSANPQTPQTAANPSKPQQTAANRPEITDTDTYDETNA